MRETKSIFIWENENIVEKNMQPGMTDGEEYKAATGIKIEFKMS